MSGTAPQSLAAVIDSQSASADGTSGAQGSPSPQIPSLSDAIVAAGLTVPSASGDAPLPEGSPTARQSHNPAAPGQSPQNPAQQTATQGEATPATQQEQAQLRQILSQKGFNIPAEYTTDDQIAELVAQELAAALDATESEDFRTFQQRKADFQRFLDQQNQQSAAQNAAQPASQPASPAPVAESAVLSAVSSGFITFDQTAKKWVSADPQFSAHAESMNQRDSRVRQMKLELAADPEAYIQARIAEALKNHKPQEDTSELKGLLDQIKQERIASQQSQIDSWAQQNASKLWDANNQPTPFLSLYQEFESALNQHDPTYAQRPLERHNEVLKRLDIAAKAFTPAAPAIPQPPAAPKTSFLDSASRRNGTNRLSEYEGPARNSVGIQIPRNGSGIPSLNGIINQMTSLSGN